MEVPRILLALSLTLGCSHVDKQGTLASLATTKQEDPGVFPLADVASESSADLQPLLRAIGSAEYIGLGESVHGSAGFYDYKIRIIKELVKSSSVRAIALETSWLDTEALQNYILHGAGSEKDVLDQLIWGAMPPAQRTAENGNPMWSDPSIAKLVQWLRQWNANHPDDKVTVFGVDRVFQVWDEAKVISSHERLAGCVGMQLKSANDYFSRFPFYAVQDAQGNWGPDRERLQSIAELEVNEAKSNLCYEAIAHTRSHLKSSNSKDPRLFAALNGIETFQRVLFHVVRYPEDLHVQNVPCPNDFGCREKLMADNLIAFNEGWNQGKKVIIWEHNGHLAKNTDHMWDLLHAKKGMGVALHERLGRNYFPVAFVAHKTLINWVAGNEPPIAPTPDSGSLEDILHLKNSGNLFVDLTAPNQFSAEKVKVSLSTGDQMSPQMPIPLSDYFAALVFLTESRASLRIEPTCTHSCTN